MKKFLICFVVFAFAYGIFDFLVFLLGDQPFLNKEYLNELRSAFTLTSILWISDRYWNHFKAPKTDILLSVSSETYQMIQNRKCIELPDGKKIDLQETKGKFIGLSPWNFNTWRSKVEIVVIDVQDQIVNLRCKTRSINKLQLFDFGYNTRFLDSISKALA